MLLTMLICWIITELSTSPLSYLLERGLFEPERGVSQMASQRNAKYAAAVGTQLLAKVHVLADKVNRLDC